MGSKKGAVFYLVVGIIIVLVLIILALLVIYFTSKGKTCVPESCVTSLGFPGTKECTSSGEKTECFLPVNLNSCDTKDGSLTKLCLYENENLAIGITKDEIKENDILVFDVNIQKAVQDYDSGIQNYIICSTSDIEEIEEIDLPKNYIELKRVNGLFCTPMFSIDEYHHLVIYGLVEKTGNFNLATLYLFEEDLKSTQAFYDNLNKGKEILNIGVEI